MLDGMTAEETRQAERERIIKMLNDRIENTSSNSKAYTHLSPGERIGMKLAIHLIEKDN